MLDIKKSYYAKDVNVGISNNLIGDILGSSNVLVKAYCERNLDTLLLTSCGGLYVTRSLGKKCSAPKKLISLFKTVSSAYGNKDGENLTCLEIGYTDDSTIIVSAYCDNSSDEMFMLFFDIVDGGVVLSANDREKVREDLVSVLEKQVVEAVEWGNVISPVPVYNIQYFFGGDNNTSSTIGSGNFYFGLSEACMENGVAGIDCREDMKKGEYSLIFLEE